MVSQFHLKADMPIGDTHSPKFPSNQEVKSWFNFLDSELDRYRDAVHNGDLQKLAQTLAEIVYITYGTAVLYGFNLDSLVSDLHSQSLVHLEERLQNERKDQVIQEEGNLPESGMLQKD